MTSPFVLAVKVTAEEYVLIFCFNASPTGSFSFSPGGISSESLAAENTRDCSSMLVAGGGST